MITLYQSLLTKQPTDYYSLLEYVVKTRCTNEYKTCAIMRDRGGKADYVQTYYYDVIQLISIVNKNVEKEKWFASIYLSWVLYETDVTLNNLCISFDVFSTLVENNLYRRVIEVNRYECYGFCMTALVLLDKVFLLKLQDDKKYVLLKLALEGIVSYIYYHKGENKLWDTEVYSGYARLFDRFKADMTLILMDRGIGSYVQYSYCFGMYEAFKSCPIECGHLIKLEYQRNALMMQQNQTVVTVTHDSMDANFFQAVSLGEQQFLSFTLRMLQYDIINVGELQEFKCFIDELNDCYNNRIEKEKGFENIRCLERFFQIEPYERYGYCKPPYKRNSFKYKDFLNHICVTESSCTKKENNKGDIILYTDILSLHPHFHLSYNYKDIQNSIIHFLRIIVRADGSMDYILVYGHNLYELYLDISRTDLFFNIPCIVVNWDPNYSCAMHKLMLFVGTNYDRKNGFKNN